MREPKAHILVVDDDDRLRELLKKFLREQGFMVTTAADAGQARHFLQIVNFDLIVLDVMMPGESGVDLLGSLPDALKRSVLMLSAMGEPDDRIRGLENGAQDYLVKPFEPKELVLRIKTILRRAAVPAERALTISFGGYCFNVTTSQLKRGEENVYLTSNEMACLKLLAENAGKPVTREALSKLMPGVGNERTVDVQITRLRKKIEESEGKPVYLQTVRGAGYVLYADKGSV
jgi:two-component system, OmpR family, phosphate regulon response regulator OmpR